MEYFNAKTELGPKEGNETQPVLVKEDSRLGYLANLKNCYDVLPRVRRALAYIPTYMAFDDHEVTDDWNISLSWVTQVGKRALGKAIVRNGLCAHALCQAWGNDPLGWSEPNRPRSALLNEIGQFFMIGSTVLPQGPPANIAASVSERLKLEQEKPAEAIPWHFSLRAPELELLGLDSRTCRGFKPDASPISWSVDSSPWCSFPATSTSRPPLR